ncbi:MAG: MraY family glycosyltransferase [Peptococcaceae bacterium]|nr:MraY family glycosyltransferase [Peptococcaceae bacterium]
MVKELILVAVCAFALTTFFVPVVKLLAVRIGAVDKPNARKVHHKLMPRMGGLAIYAAFWLVVFTFYPFSQSLLGFFLGATMLVFVGIVDDVTDMPAKLKLLGQIIAACIATFGGIRIEFITSMFGETGMMALNIFSVPVTVIWIVAIINAVNLIDGLDGLAAGVSAISATTLAICALINGLANVAVLGFALVGACLGFLIYNFHPASIFMGDTGSMFLGYTLAVFSIMGAAKGVTFVAVFIPILALGIPIFDTLFAILRRMMANKPIFEADKAHLHHRLLARGLSHRNTVLLIYGISVLLSICAIIVNELTSERGFIVVVLVLTFLLIGANKLGIIGHTNKQKKQK